MDHRLWARRRFRTAVGTYHRRAPASLPRPRCTGHDALAVEGYRSSHDRRGETSRRSCATDCDPAAPPARTAAVRRRDDERRPEATKGPKKARGRSAVPFGTLRCHVRLVGSRPSCGASSKISRSERHVEREQASSRATSFATRRARRPASGLYWLKYYQCDAPDCYSSTGSAWAVCCTAGCTYECGARDRAPR